MNQFKSIKRSNNIFRLAFFLNLSLLLIMASCTTAEKKTSVKDEKFVELKNEYAKGFSIKQFQNYYLVEVQNPWQGADNILFKYLLYTDSIVPKHNFSDAVEIQIPIKKIVCMSTTHLGFIQKLEEIESIVGISNVNLINNEKLKAQIDSGLVLDVGYEQNVNFELLLSLSPDLIMSYSIGSEFAGLENKLKEFDLNLCVNAEYLEQHPLGKAEWIKFVAMFYNKLNKANSIFKNIESEYLKLKNSIIEIENRPTVLTGLPWKGTWFVSGGKSYVAKLISDAGGQFLWNTNQSHEAIGLSIESVYEIARNADIWINTGAANSLSEIENIDERLKLFSTWENKKVFNNNALQNPEGGNDYWEQGLVNPHIILSDLIQIFHNKQIADSMLVYYKNVE